MIKKTKEDEVVLKFIKTIGKDKDLIQGMTGEDFLKVSQDILKQHLEETYGATKKFTRAEYLAFSRGLSLAVKIIEARMEIKGEDTPIGSSRMGLAVLWGISLDNAVQLDKRVQTESSLKE